MFKTKRILVCFLVMVMTMSVFSSGIVSAANAFDYEITYKDGDIELCSEDEIYINEAFDGASLPASDSKITWNFKNAVKTEDGKFSTPATGSGFGTATLVNALKFNAEAGASNKYVLSFDINRTDATGAYVYPVVFNGKNDTDLASGLSGSTYSFAGASNIPVNTWCHVDTEFVLGNTEMTFNIKVYDMSGEILGTAKEGIFDSYNADTGITDVRFGYTGGNFQFDNIKLYNYKTVLTDKYGIETEDYINVDFDGASLPANDSKVSWRFKNATQTEDGKFSTPAIGSGFGTATLANALKYNAEAGASNKYVLSFDINRTDTTGAYVYPVVFNGKNDTDLASGLSESTYSFAGAANIAVNTWSHVNVEFELGSAQMTFNIKVYDMLGNMLGTAKEGTFENYNVDTGITDVRFGYTGGNFEFDNIKLYSEKNIVIDSRITEIDIPGVPLKDADTDYIMDESFDNFADVKGNSYTDASGNIWGFSSHAAKKMETVIMSSDRKVMKLSNNVSQFFTLQVPTAISYNSEENANNTYVIRFGLKYVGGEDVAGYSTFRTYYKDGETEKYRDDINILSDGRFRTSVKEVAKTLENKWYSVALVYTFKADGANMIAYVLDGNKVTRFENIDALGMNNLHKIQFSIPNNAVIYLDNLQIYEAGSTIKEAVTPQIEVSNVKFGTASDGEALSGDVSLASVNEGTVVYASAEFAMTNEKPADTAVGIFAVYKKDEGNSQTFINSTIVDLSEAMDSDEQKQLYVSKSDSPLFTADESGEYIVKLFIWSDMGNLTPLYEAKVYAE